MALPTAREGVRALIFDFDGLILDTEVAIFDAWRELYESHGLTLTIETWAQCVGSDFGHYDPQVELEQFVGRTLDWQPLIDQRRKRVNDILTGKEPMPGVRERLREAQEHGIVCAVASSSSHHWVDGWLDRLGLASYFSHVSCLEDTGKAKPDPSLFLHAAAALKSVPEETIVLEDSLNGLRAAHAAGMRCIVVPCEVTKHLAFDGAWRHLGSLEEFTVPDLFV
ncbi:MAG: HAD family hydrolase [Roseimicrobium sp.]